MARKTEFYKGRRLRRSKVLIPTAIALGLISVLVVFFYGMQKYTVITKDRVNVELPMLAGEGALLDTDGGEVRELESTDVSIVFDAPKYDAVEPQAGEGLKAIRAIYVEAGDINSEKLKEYGARLSKGNALLLDMKPPTGLLMWDSQTSAAVSYGLTGSALPQDVVETLTELKEEQGVWLAAQISVCRDDLLASRSTIVTLRNSAGGNYTDQGGAWLDAYSVDVRRYAVELAKELFAMGFDEVVLADVQHPVLEEGVELTYTRDMSTTPGPVNAVCGFAVSVAEELRDRDGVLSIYTNSAPSLVRADTATGQDARLFFKLFDRVYYKTDRYAYTYNLSDVSPAITVGKATDRFVPVVINYLPDNSETVSWVLIDQEEN